MSQDLFSKINKIPGLMDVLNATYPEPMMVHLVFIIESFPCYQVFTAECRECFKISKFSHKTRGFPRLKIHGFFRTARFLGGFSTWSTPGSLASAQAYRRDQEHHRIQLEEHHQHCCKLLLKTKYVSFF